MNAQRLCVLLALLLFALSEVATAYPRRAEIQRGRYIMLEGDCLACHTSAGGKDLAGDRAIETPFGTIYSANITPDPETGIGRWSREQFYRAMHDGVRPDGSHLYPAMPFTYYTRMPREDVDALFAYLKTVEPVRQQIRKPELLWPLGWRRMMWFWKTLFFAPGTFTPRKDQSDVWNRGAYLVQGPGHCGACHTPKNLLGASKADRHLQGGEFQNWFAPLLTGNQRDGLANWSEAQIVEFLGTGRNEKTAAFGPMAEVVEDSTSHLTQQDLQAIAVYLKSLPAADSKTVSDAAPAIMQTGRGIFDAQCGACHQANGAGIERAFARLDGSSNVQQRSPTTVIRAILTGVRAQPTDRWPTPHAMPAFDWKLDDAQIAAVATYIRQSWGNKASSVSANDVHDIRKSVPAHDTVRANHDD